MGRPLPAQPGAFQGPNRAEQEAHFPVVTIKGTESKLSEVLRKNTQSPPQGAASFSIPALWTIVKEMAGRGQVTAERGPATLFQRGSGDICLSPP